MVDYFIQGAIEHPGRVHRYVMKEFGRKAFTQRGTIKDGYLEKAERRAWASHQTSLERAIILAKRLTNYSRNKVRA